MSNSRNLWLWTCRGCGTNKKSKTDQWWFLTDHHGLSGQFCPKCYDKIRDPEQRLIMILKLT